MAQIKTLDTVLGENYLAIQAALNVLDRSKVDLARYAIAVVQDGEDAYVLLLDRADAEAARANLGVKRDGDVALKPAVVEALLLKLDEIETLDRIRGQSLPPMEKGAATFLKQFDADLADYKIELVEDDESLVAIFADKDREDGTRGHNAKRPGYEVEMKAKDLAVVRSNFLR